MPSTRSAFQFYPPSSISRLSVGIFLPVNLIKEPTMTFSIAGGPIVGFAQQESNLDRIVRRLRAGWRSIKDILNQPGVPYEDYAS